LVLRAGVAATIANVAGDLSLPRWFGVRGVAMASCGAHAVFLVALLGLLYARNRRIFVASEAR
jgi:Na+-driven multidrug efflux pump